MVKLSDARDTNNIVLVKRTITQDALVRLADVHGRFVEQRRDGRRVIMQNCVLADLDLQRMCFAQAHFLGCDFSRANLTKADFNRAKLFASNFQEANLTRANFERADLRAASFDRAILENARFDEADMRRVGLICDEADKETEMFKEVRTSFRNANLDCTNLKNAHLKDVDFTGASLKDTALDGADLRGAVFLGAEFDGVVLTNTRLQETDMRGANFENMDFDLNGVLATPMETIRAADLHRLLAVHETWVASDGKQGARADFSEQNLSGLDLSERNLAAVSFANANLKGTNFSHCVLAACSFRGANLRDANLSKCDLRGADMTGALLDRARFEAAWFGMLPETGMDTKFPEDFELQI